MIKLLTGILFLLFTYSLSAQTRIYSCSYYGEKAKMTRMDICLQNNSFAFGQSDDSRAITIVDKIMQEVGLPRNFLVVECPEIENCKAVNYLAKTGSLRYIVYDDKFLRTLDTASATADDYWGSISIMAHEIGHHLCGHTLDSIGSRPDKELEADAFSGFIMYKLGATLDQAQAVFKAMTELYGDATIVSTHPPLRNRLAAIRSGWNNGWSSNYRQQQNKNERPVLASWDDIAMELYNDAYLLNKTGKYKEAALKASTAIHLKKDFADAYVQRGLAEANLLQTTEALKTLDSALAIDPALTIARAYKGRAYTNSKSYSFAEFEFIVTIKKDSLNPVAWAERALLRNTQGLYDKAIKDAETALDLGYQDVHIPLGVIGYAYFKKKKYTEATYFFAQALEYNPIDEFSSKWEQQAYKLMKAAEKKPKTGVKK